MEFKDYYSVLGVSPDADDTEIKAAYRKLARKYHPDRSQEEGAEARFKEVAEAWQVLKDADKRAEYDQLRRYQAQGSRAGFEPPPGWQPSEGFSFEGDGAGFSDFFEALFGGGRQGFGQRSAPPRRGQDVEIELPVFLEETLQAHSKAVAYRVPHYNEQGVPLGEKEKKLNVKIPAGVADGERIRLKGQGVPGLAGAPSGDLYLRVRLVPHPLFDVEGHNLVITVPVAPWELALGEKVHIPTLHGDIQLKIPPNSQNGQKMRISGKGLPGKAGTGDLIAVLKVNMPDTQTDATDKLWQQLAETAHFDARANWRK